VNSSTIKKQNAQQHTPVIDSPEKMSKSSVHGRFNVAKFLHKKKKQKKSPQSTHETVQFQTLAPKRKSRHEARHQKGRESPRRRRAFTPTEFAIARTP